jgi:hypothetical protein
MKQTKYINRYGDKILFTEISPNEVEMSGFEYYRYGDDFVDPSGGPYISVGTDIGRYFEDGIERRVISVFISEEKIILTY